jgi:hypothetical protein
MLSIVVLHIQEIASHKSISAHTLIIAKKSTLFLNIQEGCSIMQDLSVLYLLESAVSQAKQHIEFLPSSKPRVHRRTLVDYNHIAYCTAR